MYHVKFVLSSMLDNTLGATRFNTKCGSIVMCFLTGVGTATVLSAAARDRKLSQCSGLGPPSRQRFPALLDVSGRLQGSSKIQEEPCRDSLECGLVSYVSKGKDAREKR